MRKIEELWELLKDVELVQVRPSEMEAIYKHIFEFRNPTIVEIGSAHGASSIILANAAREMQGHLICIDSFPEYYYGQEKFGNYARVAFLKNLYPYRGNLNLIDKPSDQAIEYGKKNFMDFACYGLMFCLLMVTTPMLGSSLTVNFTYLYLSQVVTSLFMITITSLLE
jgi:hypothetical protein